MAKSGKMSFEEAMQRLDAIVDAMESGEIGIEESIAKYEEAMKLAVHCRKVLEDAELRIQKIQVDAGGVKATPFEQATEADGEDEADET